MTDATPAYPLLFPPHIGAGEEQRAYYHRRFAEFSDHLAACRQDETYQFAVDDLDVFRAFLASHCDQRASLRDLIAAGRVTVVCHRAPQTDDWLQIERWRRNAMYGAQCWEGILGGTLDPDAAGEPVPTAPAQEDGLPRAIARTAAALLHAEKLAALALLAGLPYPTRELDYAWRQLLFAQRGLGASGSPEDIWYVDVRAACHQAWSLGVEARACASYLFSEQVNTASAKGAAADGSSLVVINVSGRAYRGPCRTRVELAGALASGFTLRGPNGRPVPYQVTAVRRSHDRAWAEIAFEVSDVPALGHRTYSLGPAAGLPEPTSLEAAPEAPVTVVWTGIHLGPLPPDFALLTTDAPAVELSALKPLGHPPVEGLSEAAPSFADGILLQLRETAGQPQEVALGFAYEPVEAWRANPLERKSEGVKAARGPLKRPRVPVQIGAHETLSLAVRLKLPAIEPRPTDPVLTSADRERLVFGRYWEHNAGAAPITNLSLGIWVGGELRRGRNTRFPISLSNDSADREYVGAVDLRAPEGWTLIPRRIPYRVAPGSQGLFEAMVVVPDDAEPCFLRAETADGRRVVQDVRPVGEIQPLAVSLARDRKLVVRITNPNADYVEGQVALIRGPQPQWFRLAAGETEEFFFLSGADAVAKVTWYGNVQYVREGG